MGWPAPLSCRVKRDGHQRDGNWFDADCGSENGPGQEQRQRGEVGRERAGDPAPAAAAPGRCEACGGTADLPGDDGGVLRGHLISAVRCGSRAKRSD